MLRRRGWTLAAASVLAVVFVGGVGVIAPSPRQRAAAEDAPAPNASDAFRYERRKVTVAKDGKETLGDPDPVVVHRWESRDEGRWLPVSAVRQDLPLILVLCRMKAGATTRRFAFRDVVETVAEGTFRSTAAQNGGTQYTAQWTLVSKGRGEEPWVIRDGSASVVIDEDAAGVVTHARLTLQYKLVRREAKKGDDVKVTDEVLDFTLKDAKPARYREFHADVNASIDRGVEQLKKMQKEDGNFDPHGDWTAGTTALALYTLLSCGVPRDDPVVAKGLEALAQRDPTRTYETALGLMAAERAWIEPGNVASEEKRGAGMPKELRAWCERAAQRLAVQCPSPGSWGYPNAGNELYKMDSSNTQYGALGLRAAARLGIPVDEGTWLGLIRHFRLCREKDAPRGQVLLFGEREGRSAATAATIAPVVVKNMAGFKYRPHEARVWGSMTCAGIASLSIARDELRRMRSKKLSAGDDAEIDEMIAGGWAWLSANWALDRHPRHPGGDWRLYWLYSLERAGLLTGVRLVDGRDWYFDGAIELITEQEKDGGWKEGGGERTTPTCFALLFLKRATAPAAATTGK